MSPHKPREAELSSNMEDYLETIYLQDLEGIAAKVKNIADVMGVSKPSVTEALSVLQDRGLVLHQKYGDIELTEKGRDMASKIYFRHALFTRFFHNVLAIPEELAEDDACKVEHMVSETTVRRIHALVKYLDKVTGDGGDFSGFLERFHREMNALEKQ